MKPKTEEEWEQIFTQILKKLTRRSIINHMYQTKKTMDMFVQTKYPRVTC